jgi:5-methylcytosine-specific restriction protein A
MPYKPLKPCKHTGCANLTAYVFCEEHQSLHTNHRSNATERGYDSRWRKARNIFLKAHPLCTECLKQGKVTQATVVDHVVPHRGDKVLFWDECNWQSLCKSCHDKKTMTEDRHQAYKF